LAFESSSLEALFVFKVDRSGGCRSVVLIPAERLTWPIRRLNRGQKTSPFLLMQTNVNKIISAS
jgi:hypothetical protein